MATTLVLALVRTTPIKVHICSARLVHDSSQYQYELLNKFNVDCIECMRPAMGRINGGPKAGGGRIAMYTG